MFGITLEHLNPAAKKILDSPNSFFVIRDGEITWKGFERDLQVFDEIIGGLVRSHQESDEEFRRNTIPRVDIILAGAEFFARLGYIDIIVTLAHNGTTPYFHNLNALKFLDTSPFKEYPEFVFVLRLAALFHDIGKGMSAEVTQRPEVQQALKNSLNSHPGHAAMSAFILQKLCSYSRWLSEDMSLLFEDVITLVFHHHLFANAKLKRDGESIDTLIEKYNHQPRFILLLFLLTRADVAATPYYHDKWPDNIQLLETIDERGVFSKCKVLAQACLGLSELLVQTPTV